MTWHMYCHVRFATVPLKLWRSTNKWFCNQNNGKKMWELINYQIKIRQHLSHYWFELNRFKLAMPLLNLQQYSPLKNTRLYLSGKDLSQFLHCIGFSLVCSFWTWSRRSVFRPQVVGHSSHWYTGFSPKIQSYLKYCMGKYFVEITPPPI